MHLLLLTINLNRQLQCHLPTLHETTSHPRLLRDQVRLPPTPFRPHGIATRSTQVPSHPPVAMTPSTAAKHARAMKKLDASFNPTGTRGLSADATAEDQDATSPDSGEFNTMIEVTDAFIFSVTLLTSDPGEPTIYHQEMAGPEKTQWTLAI